MAINKEFNGLKMNTIICFLERIMAAFNEFHDFHGLFMGFFLGDLIGF